MIHFHHVSKTYKEDYFCDLILGEGLRVFELSDLARKAEVVIERYDQNQTQDDEYHFRRTGH